MSLCSSGCSSSSDFKSNDELESDESESDESNSDVVGDHSGSIFPLETGDVLDEGGVSCRTLSASASDMSSR